MISVPHKHFHVGWCRNPGFPPTLSPPTQILTRDRVTEKKRLSKFTPQSSPHTRQKPQIKIWTVLRVSKNVKIWELQCGTINWFVDFEEKNDNIPSKAEDMVTLWSLLNTISKSMWMVTRYIYIYVYIFIYTHRRIVSEASFVTAKSEHNPDLHQQSKE